MDGTRYQLFTGPGLSGDEDGDIPTGHGLDLLPDIHHLLALTYKYREVDPMLALSLMFY